MNNGNSQSILKLISKLNKYQHRALYGGSSERNVYAQKVEQYKKELVGAGVNLNSIQTGGVMSTDFTEVFAKMTTELKNQVSTITGTLAKLEAVGGVNDEELTRLTQKIDALKAKMGGSDSDLINLAKMAFQAHVNAKVEMLNINKALEAKQKALKETGGNANAIAKLDEVIDGVNNVVPTTSALNDVVVSALAEAEMMTWNNADYDKDIAAAELKGSIELVNGMGTAGALQAKLGELAAAAGTDVQAKWAEIQALL